MALFRLNFCCSVTFEGIHWFHSNFAELYITVNYRSSWILIIIRQIWLSYGSVSNCILLLCWYWFLINNFCRKALILLKVCRRIYHCKIQVTFNIRNHLQSFGWVMAFFWPSFCWFVDTDFHLLTFAGMHWFYWKFAEGFIIVKYRSSSIFVIIHNILGKLGPFFDLVAFRDRSDYRDQCCFPFSYQMVGALSRLYTHPILENLVELFHFNKITLKSCIFVLLLLSWASNVGVKQC